MTFFIPHAEPSVLIKNLNGLELNAVISGFVDFW